MRIRAIALLMLVVGVSRLAAQTSYQLWQVGGYPMSIQSPFGEPGGPLMEANPAWQTAGKGAAAVVWQLQTGDPRKTLVKAMPRHDSQLPQAAGVQGAWHELLWRAGFQQVYNSHEESIDHAAAWHPYDARLEGLGVQLAMPLSMPYLTEFPQVIVGLGLTRYRLVTDQFSAWSGVVAGDTLDFQYHLDRKLLADGLSLGLELVHHDVQIGLSWREETVWNHWGREALNADSMGIVQVRGVLPEQWSVQLDLPARPGWRVSGQLQWTEWSAAQLALKDQLDMGLVVRGALPRWKSRVQVGFTTSGTASSNVLAWGEERSTWFLLAGLERDFPRGITASLKLADSHLGSGEFRKQTIVRAGVQVEVGALQR